MMTVADSDLLALPARAALPISGKSITVPISHSPARRANLPSADLGSCTNLAARRVNGLLTRRL
jgi:hypothetical protein